MTRVVWTEPAVADLESIHAYIAADSQTYAHALLDEIFAAVDRLERFPQSGHLLPEVDDDNLREVVVGNYRVIHEAAGGVVRILAILHGARRLTVD